MNRCVLSRSLAVVFFLMICVVGLSLTATGSVAAQQVDVAASDLDGSGTQADPYVITNASELQAMEDDLDAHYELGSDIDASNTAQWNNGSGFDPIEGLSGTFNGAGHTIGSLTINRSTMSGVGLFSGIGSIDGGGQVYNLTISDADVSGDFNVGILTGGNNEESTISNVAINGTVDAKSSVGGIAGLNQGEIFNSSSDVSATGGNEAAGITSANQGLIENVSVSGSIDGSKSVAGVVGSNYGMIRQARSKAVINGTDFVGGLVGYNYNTTVLSFASGSVTGSYSVGGLTGANQGNVTRTYATGSVNADDRVGGLTGGSFLGGNVTESFTTAAVTGQSNTGGSVGFAFNTTIKNVYWDMDATSQTTSAGSATGLNTSQMTGDAARENMTGFDFSTAWQSQAGGYPTLVAISEINPNDDSYNNRAGSGGSGGADSVVATDGSGDYTSIQNAVDNANDTDRIEVNPGKYEEPIDIRKNISLVAPHGATIANTSTVANNYFSTRFGVQIHENTTPTISGFTLSNWEIGVSAGPSKGSWTARNLTISGSSCSVCAAGTPGDWTLQNATIKNTDTAVSAYQSTGNWKIANSTIYGDISAQESSGDQLVQNTTIERADEGISIADSTANLTVRSTLMKNLTYMGVKAERTSGKIVLSNMTIQDADTGVDFENSSVNITVRSSKMKNITYDGIEFEVAKSSSRILVQDTSVQTAVNGINGEKSDTQVNIINLTVNNTDGDGIDASNATGDWTVQQSVFKQVGDKSIDVIDSGGKWQIHESILTGGREGTLDAWDSEILVNATHNYWGAADGPSETFCGSGGAIGGYNVTMYPYYTDSSLTTLSSATTSGTVEITDSCLIPEDINSSDEETLTVTVAQMSADGETDEISITMPEDVSVNNVNNPQAVGTPYEVNVTNDGDPVTLEVNPDEPTETVDFVIRVPMELSSSSG